MNEREMSKFEPDIMRKNARGSKLRSQRIRKGYLSPWMPPYGVVNYPNPERKRLLQKFRYIDDLTLPE